MQRTLNSVVLTAAVLLGSCSDDGDPLLPPERFETPESVVMALGLTEIGAMLVPPLSVSKARTQCLATNPSSVACNGGGTVATSDPEPLDVESPYAEGPFLVTTHKYDHCRIVTTGCFSTDPTVETTGTSRSGVPEGAPASPPTSPPPEFLSFVAFESRGDGGAPLTTIYTFPDGSSFHLSETSVVQRLHREPWNIFNPRPFFDDSITVATLSGRREIPGQPATEFHATRGTSAEPYVVRNAVGGADWSVSVEGALSRIGDGCEVGAFSVSTRDPIRYSYGAQFNDWPRLHSGQLVLSSIGGRATVRIIEDRIVVTDARGHETRYEKDNPELGRLLLACSGGSSEEEGPPPDDGG